MDIENGTLTTYVPNLRSTTDGMRRVTIQLDNVWRGRNVTKFREILPHSCHDRLSRSSRDILGRNVLNQIWVRTFEHNWSSRQRTSYLYIYYKNWSTWSMCTIRSKYSYYFPIGNFYADDRKTLQRFLKIIRNYFQFVMYFFGRKAERESQKSGCPKELHRNPFTQTNLASHTTSCTEGITRRPGTGRSSNEAENARTSWFWRRRRHWIPPMCCRAGSSRPSSGGALFWSAQKLAVSTLNLSSQDHKASPSPVSILDRCAPCDDERHPVLPHCGRPPWAGDQSRVCGELRTVPRSETATTSTRVRPSCWTLPSPCPRRAGWWKLELRPLCTLGPQRPPTGGPFSPTPLPRSTLHDDGQICHVGGHTGRNAWTEGRASAGVFTGRHGRVGHQPE